MGDENGEVSIKEVSVGIVGSGESTDIDWASLAEEEELKEARLRSIKSLKELGLLKSSLRVMIKFIGQ